MRALVSIPRNPPPCLRQAQEWSNEFNDFIRQCLIKDFETRPTVAQMLTHAFISQVPEDGMDARRRITQIVQRYKRCYDLSGNKSRETCGVKNGHIRGKSETSSSAMIEAIAATAAVASNSPAADSVIPPPLKRIIQVIGKPYNPPHQSEEPHKRAAPPPPMSMENVLSPNRGVAEANGRQPAEHTQIYKTKRKSQSRRHQKQMAQVCSFSIVNVQDASFLVAQWPQCCPYRQHKRGVGQGCHSHSSNSVF